MKRMLTVEQRESEGRQSSKGKQRGGTPAKGSRRETVEQRESEGWEVRV